MRRTARGLGRLARNARLLGLVAFTGFAAAGAGAAAAPAPQLFRLTIRATAVADFDHTPAPADSGGCTTTQRAEGFLTVHFGTRRPVLVRFVNGRLQTALVGPVDGTAKLAGTNDVERRCGADVTHTPEFCRGTTRTFRGAKTTLRGRRAGSVAIAAIRVRLRPIECPREPAELRRAILGPVPGELKVPASFVANPRVHRITVRGSGQRTLTYGQLESGSLQQRSAWTLTFVRTAR